MKALTGRSTAAIGVLDSGVGGLSVFEVVQRKLPHARFHYCADNANFPYGTRSEDEVIACVMNASKRFVAKCRLDMLIIACGTASTAVLPPLRAELSIPVIGVVPAIKPAAALTKTGCIALLATEGTVRRAYTDELIAKFAGSCKVIKSGSSVLVELGEKKLRGEAIDLELVRKELMPIFDWSPQEPEQRVDVIVLGCTHFPLLTAELSAVAPWSVAWIDPGEAIAARASFLLGEAGFIGSKTTDPDTMAAHACVTRLDSSAEALRAAFRRYGFTELVGI